MRPVLFLGIVLCLIGCNKKVDYLYTWTQPVEPRPPVITPHPGCGLSANPSQLIVGQTLQLDLTTRGEVTSARIEGETVSFPHGSRGIVPQSAGTFTAEGIATGPGGIWTAPHFSQEIVTANKLGLSKAVALKEVDQATLNTVAERYRLFTDVRQSYYAVLLLQKR